ncbi:MAG: hypothetical protein EOP49_40480 [Sphingobacteriales bacterium]|nr:MAG: hypothetical protein EOP49_40480 [Sphingobacteriales bacterium]
MNSNNYKRGMLLWIVIAASCLTASGQVDTTNPSGLNAWRVGQKMRDTLGLNSEQTQSLTRLTLVLQNRKTTVWYNYQGIDSVRFYVQTLENKRDSLYRPVLTEQQYNLYLQKKSSLISGH